MSALGADDPGPAPRALFWAVAAALLGVALLLALETQVWRPFYATGDEAIAAGQLARLRMGDPFFWAPAQGCLTRAFSWGCLSLFGAGAGRLALPSLAVFGLELALLWRVARRWAGAEAAAWALLVDLLNANSWLRARSLLSFHSLPAELLLLAWAAGRVRGPKGAFAWGLGVTALALDYEGGLAAAPFLVVVAMAFEPDLRRRWRPAFGGLMAGGLALAAALGGDWAAYVRIRASNSLATPAGAGGWAANLSGFIHGGVPRTYMGVEAWPAFAPWAWLGLGLGLVGLGAESWTLGAWALGVTLLVSLGQAPAGLPVERLSAAWPALCLLSGLGLKRLRGAWGRGGVLLTLLLVAGAGTELNAYLRQMALQGGAGWGRSQRMELAAQRVDQAVAASGAGVATAWMELRHPEVRLHLQPRAGTPGVDDLWALLPPGSGAAPSGPGWSLESVAGPAQVEPVLLVHAQGAPARRLRAMEDDLRGLLRPGLDSRRRLAWLESLGHDPLAWSEVLAAELIWAGSHGQLDARHWALVARDPGLCPDLTVTEARLVLAQQPQRALSLARQALARDPGYSPAWSVTVQALQALGRPADAARARDEWAARWRAGTAPQFYE